MSIIDDDDDDGHLHQNHHHYCMIAVLADIWNGCELGLTSVQKEKEPSISPLMTVKSFCPGDFSRAESKRMSLDYVGEHVVQGTS